MFLFLILILSIPNVIFNAGLDIFRPKITKLDRLEGKCSKYPNAVITFDNIVMTKVQRVYSLSAKIVIRNDIREDMKMQVTPVRCKNRDAPDTCEQYPRINVKKVCNLINGANHTFTPFLEHTSPKIQCPLPKGIYHVVNGTFDGNVLSRFPLDDWYWKLTTVTRGMTSERVIMCTYLEGQIVPV